MQNNGIKSIKACRYISPYFLDAWGLDADTQLEVKTVCPQQLLSVNRFDLACKLYYIDCVEKNLDRTFAKNLYAEHIKAFSDGAFIEPGLKTKNSVNDYFDGFDKLIEDIKRDGFDCEKSVVPASEDGVILDGSHRVAIAIYYEIPLPVVTIPNKTCCYDYTYFEQKGMSAEHLDFMAYQFMRFTKQAYAVCLWPAAFDGKKLSQADEIIRKCASVAYKKQVLLNYHGLEQLMTAFYRSMEWTGSIDNAYCGVAGKALHSYKKNAPVTMYVICGVPLETVLGIKERIRDIYKIDNDSVHITDTHDEALEAGKMLLNKNSVHFLNYGKPLENKELANALDSGKTEGTMSEVLSLYALAQTEEYNAAVPHLSPTDCMFFWGQRLPSLEYVKRHIKDRQIIAQIEKLEKTERRASGSFCDGIKLLLKKASTGLAEKFSETVSSFKRKLKVIYHRFKYKGQNCGSGKTDIENLQDVFLNINTTTSDYLVMRNWEGFYDDILLDGHNDIDVLCRDTDSRDIMVRMLDAKPITFDGFHYIFTYKGREVVLDTRIMGDGYYDRRWQKSMLRTKKLHPQGFYIMDSENYYYSLAYHAIYQKKAGLSDEYAQRLNKMSGARNKKQSDFADELNSFMKAKSYAYTMTLDKSVVKSFDNTPLDKKIRYPMNIRVHHFCGYIKSRELLQKLKIKIRNLIIRG